MAKGLTKKITRRAARSYRKTVPNPLGVTAIAAVNPGRGAAYRRAYLATHELLTGGSMKRRHRRSKAKSNKKRRHVRHHARPNKRRHARKHARRNSAVANRRHAGRRHGFRRNAMGEPTTAERLGGFPFEQPRAASAGGGVSARWGLRFTPKALKKAGYTAKQIQKIFGKDKLRSLSRRSAAAKKAASRRRAAMIGKRYGKYRTVPASLGGFRTHTYVTKGRRPGKFRHVPIWALAGAKSARAAKGDEKVQAKMARIRARRASAAKRVGAFGSVFTPNADDVQVLTYKEWSDMTPNKRRGKKRHHKKYASNRKHRRHARRNQGAVAAAPNRKHRRGKKRHYSANKRKHKLFHSIKHPGALKSHVRHEAREIAQFIAKRGKKRSHGVSKKAARRAAARVRRYIGNPFVATFVTLFKQGLAAAVGFLGHGALSQAGVEYGLDKIDALGTPNLAPWKKPLAGLVVAGVGALVIDKAPVPMKLQVGTGVFASLVRQVIVAIAHVAKADNVVGYLGEAPYYDRSGRVPLRGWGEYLATNGYGEYLATSGMGAYELQQAAAGFGQLTQAAAGFGQLTQAAAGMGEYIAQGVQGIGEYELSGDGIMQAAAGMGVVDDGIGPDLASAERALTIAEAAAGIGDIPLMNTGQPVDTVVPIDDTPAADRAGILQGGDGIFG